MQKYVPFSSTYNITQHVSNLEGHLQVILFHFTLLSALQGVILAQNNAVWQISYIKTPEYDHLGLKLVVLKYTCKRVE
jgi:hypothetical protein